MKTEIKKGEHVFISGRTGSGKTVLAEAYCSGRDNVVCLDTKGETDWKTIPDIEVFEHLKDLESFGEGKAIYRPHHSEMNSEFYDKFFKWIYDRKYTDVWVDELMSIYENAGTILPYHKAIMTRGRTKEISCFNVTQRPKTIPLSILSESKHFFIYDLNLDADRKRIMEVVPFKEINEIPSKVGGDFAFWYYNFKMDKPQLGKLKL